MPVVDPNHHAETDYRDPDAIEALGEAWKSQAQRLVTLKSTVDTASDGATWTGGARTAEGNLVGKLTGAIDKSREGADKVGDSLKEFAGKLRELIKQERADFITELVGTLLSLFTLGIGRLIMVAVRYVVSALTVILRAIPVINIVAVPVATFLGSATVFAGLQFTIDMVSELIGDVSAGAHWQVNWTSEVVNVVVAALVGGFTGLNEPLLGGPNPDRFGIQGNHLDLGQGPHWQPGEWNVWSGLNQPHTFFQYFDHPWNDFSTTPGTGPVRSPSETTLRPQPGLVRPPSLASSEHSSSTTLAGDHQVLTPAPVPSRRPPAADPPTPAGRDNPGSRPPSGDSVGDRITPPAESVRYAAPPPARTSGSPGGGAPVGIRDAQPVPARGEPVPPGRGPEAGNAPRGPEPVRSGEPAVRGATPGRPDDPVRGASPGRPTDPRPADPVRDATVQRPTDPAAGSGRPPHQGEPPANRGGSGRPTSEQRQQATQEAADRFREQRAPEVFKWRSQDPAFRGRAETRQAAFDQQRDAAGLPRRDLGPREHLDRDRAETHQAHQQRRSEIEDAARVARENPVAPPAATRDTPGHQWHDSERFAANRADRQSQYDAEQLRQGRQTHQLSPGEHADIEIARGHRAADQAPPADRRGVGGGSRPARPEPVPARGPGDPRTTTTGTARDTPPAASARDTQPPASARDTQPAAAGRGTQPPVSARDTQPPASARDNQPSGSGGDTQPSGSGRDVQPSGSTRDGGSDAARAARDRNYTRLTGDSSDSGTPSQSSRHDQPAAPPPPPGPAHRFEGAGDILGGTAGGAARRFVDRYRNPDSTDAGRAGRVRDYDQLTGHPDGPQAPPVPPAVPDSAFPGWGRPLRDSPGFTPDTVRDMIADHHRQGFTPAEYTRRVWESVELPAGPGERPGTPNTGPEPAELPGHLQPGRPTRTGPAGDDWIAGVPRDHTGFPGQPPRTINDLPREELPTAGSGAPPGPPGGGGGNPPSPRGTGGADRPAGPAAGTGRGMTDRPAAGDLPARGTGTPPAGRVRTLRDVLGDPPPAATADTGAGREGGSGHDGGGLRPNRGQGSQTVTETRGGTGTHEPGAAPERFPGKGQVLDPDAPPSRGRTSDQPAGTDVPAPAATEVPAPAATDVPASTGRRLDEHRQYTASERDQDFHRVRQEQELRWSSRDTGQPVDSITHSPSPVTAEHPTSVTESAPAATDRPASGVTPATADRPASEETPVAAESTPPTAETPAAHAPTPTSPASTGHAAAVDTAPVDTAPVDTAPVDADGHRG